MANYMKIVDLKHKSWLTLQIEKTRFIFVGLPLQSVLNMFDDIYITIIRSIFYFIFDII